MTHYTRANAEALLSVVTLQPNCHWLPIPSEPDSVSPSPIYINDDGIFPNLTAEAELRWKPCHELPDGPDALDRAAQPGLPFPFTANQLAAWMLNGVGALVASAFGNLVEREPVEGEQVGQPAVLGPDFSALTDPDANRAREAIRVAFDIYREAVAHVGAEPKFSPTDDVISRDEMRNDALVNHGLKSPQGAVTQGLGYRAAAEKIRLVRTDVRDAYQTAMVRRAVHSPDAKHAKWLAGMVRRLLVSDSHSPEAQGRDVQATSKKHVYRQREQADLILREIHAIGWNPLELPANRPGKAGARKQIRERLEGKHHLFPERTTVFNKAWEGLQERDEIAQRKS